MRLTVQALAALGGSSLVAAAGCGIGPAGQPRTEGEYVEPNEGPGGNRGGGDGSAPAGADAGGEPACTDPALGFDGVDDFATVSSGSGFDLSGDFTVEAWIRPGVKVMSGAEMVIASHHDPRDGGWVLKVKEHRVEIVVYGEETLSAKGYSAGNAGGGYVLPDHWAHVAGTLEGDTLRVYYNRVLRDTQTLGFFFGRRNANVSLHVGRNAYEPSGWFQGTIDDLRLSKNARYTKGTLPVPASALAVESATIALYHFDEKTGDSLVDVSAGNHPGLLAAGVQAPARIEALCVPLRPKN